MKNTFSAACLLLAIILAAVCGLQAFQKSGLDRRVASLEGSLREKETLEQGARARLERITRQKEAFKRRAELLAAELKTNRVALASHIARGASGKKDQTSLGDALTKMMSDPEMKKALRSQQDTLLDSAYASLFKIMGLSSNETTSLKNMLLDEQIKETEHSIALLRPGLGKAGQTNALNEIAGLRTAFDAKLKDFLGDARYAQYVDYNQAVAQRVALEQLTQQLATSSSPITDEQGQQLLQLMAEEQRGMPALFNPNDPVGIAEAASLQSLSEDKMNEVLLAIEESDQRVLQRAADILTADQLQGLSTLLAAQHQMQLATLAVARTFGTQQTAP